jgi:hypothetical protein
MNRDNHKNAQAHPKSLSKTSNNYMLDNLYNIL